MALFYLPDLNCDKFSLPPEESLHVSKVLRLQEGDRIDITDGKGSLCQCNIAKIDKKQVWLYVVRRDENTAKWPYRLHMAVAPTKNSDRFEWFLEKATEIGVDEITPVISRNSERTRIRPDRMEKIIIAAMKQSLKTYKPHLNQIAGVSDFLSKRFADYQLFIAYCGEAEKVALKEAYQPGRNAVILVGPEGDFTAEEVGEAVSKGYMPVSLGKSRLRTETAGILSCHTVSLLNE